MKTRSNLLVLAATAILIVAVSKVAWAGAPVTCESVEDLLIFALPLAGIYAMSATGLVVVYTTTGIFNFAQGAIGMFLAYVDWELSVNHGMPQLIAVPLTVLVIAPLIGIGLDRAIMRHLQGKELVVQLLVTVGLMFAFIGLANMIWDQNLNHTLPTLFGQGGFHVAGVVVTWARGLTVVLAIVLAIGLRLLLFRTRLGVSMRAVVDNRGLASLVGARSERVSGFSWALGCSLAALAGILLAPDTGMSTSGPLTLLIITSFAAAAVGRIRSLPLTYLGAAILALSLQYSQTFLQFSGRWSNAPAAIPTVMLFVVLLLLPQAPLKFARLNMVRRTERVSTVRDTVMGMVVLFVVMAVVSLFLSPTNLNRFALAMCTALVALSLVPLIGWAGQVSLAGLAFAGVGVVAYARLGGLHGNGYAVIIASLVVVPVGALLALPALRLQGLYLALATLSFASLVELVFFLQPFALGSQSRAAGRLQLFGMHFDGTRTFLLLVTAVFGIVGIGTVALRRSAFGRRLIALRDSEAAAATIGVNVLETKVAVFMLSAAMAGFAGAFLAQYYETINQAQFSMLGGLPLVLALVIGGVGTVAGALFAGIFGLGLIILQETWHLTLFRAIEFLAPGLAALGIIQNPSGAVVPMGEGFAPLLPWRKDAKAEAEEMKAQLADPEVGELGIDRPFTEADVIILDRGLAITNDLPRSEYAGATGGLIAMALLEIREVSVSFGGLLALGGASIEVEAGQVTGLIGPNGAGKTTLFNVITGLQTPTSGAVRLDGKDITRTKKHARARIGIARTFQRLEPFGSLTARENVLVALEMRRRWAKEKYDPGTVADELLDQVGIGVVANRKVDSLPTGTARLVELAHGTAPRVLLLDEPSSGLSEEETDAMGKLLLELAVGGLGILLVEHDMSFVMGTCAYINVLDFGRIIAHGHPDEIQVDPEVQRAYLGVAADGVVMTAVDVAIDHQLPEPPVLELQSVRAGYGRIDVLHGVNLSLAPGQVYALLGPNGAGKSTTLAVASGQIVPNSGSLHVCGRDVTGVTADVLARAGVCLIPEGRGIFPNLTVTENLRMATFTGTHFGEVQEKVFTQFPRLQERRKQTAGTLSGGEQQMLAMGRALATNPAVLLIDELSMGLAPLIVSELYDHVRRIAASGLSIVIVEQFVHEILGVADTAGIMLHGHIVETGTPAQIADDLASAYLGGMHS